MNDQIKKRYDDIIKKEMEKVYDTAFKDGIRCIAFVIENILNEKETSTETDNEHPKEV
jgi:hypothetical protein